MVRLRSSKIKDVRTEVINEFRAKYDNLSGKQESRIGEFYRLYSDGKIPTKIGLNKAITTYLSPKIKDENKREIAYLKLLLKYYKTTPVREKNKQKKFEKAHEEVKTKFTEFKKQVKEMIPPKSRYSVNVIIYSDIAQETEDGKIKKPSRRFKDTNGVITPYWIVKYPTLRVKAPNPFPKDLAGKFITLANHKEMFNRLLKIMLTDKNFEELYNSSKGEYIRAFEVTQVHRLESKRKYQVLDEQLRDTRDISIYYRYVNTELNLKSNSLKQSLENENYIENECWFNTIHDTYKDTLMIGSQRREALTREKLLDIIGKSEENVKQGLTINEMLPFFQKYKISIKVYNKFYQLVFSYEPEGGGTIIIETCIA
jgi:hypothetical protein